MSKFNLGKGRRATFDRDAAEAIAAGVLGFLGADPTRLAAFLGATGLTPQSLRAAAGEPGFLTGLLDYIASDEELLLAYAGEIGESPERVMAARALLSPLA